jgi:hypothetical protein
MPIRATFDPRPLQRRLQNRSRGFSAALPEVLRRAGRLVSVSLATSTQPYGIDEGARQMGEAATAGDIRRCYATPGNVFAAFDSKNQAKAFWVEIAKGNFSKAQVIMQSYCRAFSAKEIRPFDGGTAHRANRNARGRVSKRQDPVFVVQTTRNLTAYVKTHVDHVGEGKAGWAACAKILGGTRGLPQWVTRHAGKLSSGTVIEDHNPQRPTITLRNEVAYAQNILNPGDKATAVAIALDRLTAALVSEERRVATRTPLS